MFQSRCTYLFFWCPCESVKYKLLIFPHFGSSKYIDLTDTIKHMKQNIRLVIFKFSHVTTSQPGSIDQYTDNNKTIPPCVKVYHWGKLYSDYLRRESNFLALCARSLSMHVRMLLYLHVGSRITITQAHTQTMQ